VEYEIQDMGEYLLLTLSGEVDLFNSPHARQVILSSIDDKRDLLIDLSGVKYIDSSGVASLVEGYQTAKNMQVNYGLVNVSEAAMNVLNLAHLDKVFPMYQSADEFLNSAK
jgi:anti-sigma B factor antagonist